MQENNKLKTSDYISLVSLLCIVILTLSQAITSYYSKWSIFGILGGLMQIIGALGLPLALMISGYIITNKTKDIYDYYKKVAKYFIIPMLVYTLILKLLSYGNYKSVWYVSVFIGMVICAPFINILLENISEKLLKILVILIIVIRATQIYLPLFGVNLNIDLGIFNTWLIFYIIGYSLTKLTSPKIKNSIYKLGIISFIFTFLLRGVNVDFNIFTTSPTMIFYSSAVFLKLIEYKWNRIEEKQYINKFLNFFNEYKVGIFFTHNYIIINLLQNKFNLSTVRFKVVIGSLLVFIITTILSSIMVLLVDKYLIPTVSKLLRKAISRDKVKKIKVKAVNNKQYIIWIVASLAITLIIEMISRGSIENAFGFTSAYIKRFVPNYLIVLTITSPCLLFKRGYFIFTIIAEVLLILAISNYIVTSFRGVPITYSDLYSIKDGIAIAKQYINAGMVVAFLLVIILLGVIAFKTYVFKINNSWKHKKISIVLIGVIAVFTGISIKQGVNKGTLIPNQWDLKLSYDDNGFVYSLYNSYESYKRKKPHLYSKESINEIKNRIFKNNPEDENTETPNIIVVQLESVMDPMRIEDVEYSKDPMKNLRNAAKKYSSGKLEVPTFGGGTARSEFEVLTGINLDYLSPGEIPHNSILKKQAVESLAYVLNKEQYENTLIHNFEGSFYGRNKVYENLGFNTYIPLEYMYNIENPYSYPSDKLVVQNIKDTIKSTEKRDFILALGVQTHGGYSHEYYNEDSEIKVTGDLEQGKLNQIQDYIDDLVMVDEFMGQLIKYVENLEEPTILAIYSDHLPSLDAVNEGIGDKDKYTTEYIICDNLGLKKQNKNLQAYELSTEVLSRVGINGGVMNRFHTEYKDDLDYDEKLELLQYDILNGSNYIFDGQNKYSKENMKLGLEEITIDNIKIEKNKIKVIGKGFNKFSRIYIDGKSIETEYKSDRELTGTLTNNEIKKVTVHQLSRYQKSIGSTKTYILNNDK